jgi:hypothetical protein
MREDWFFLAWEGCDEFVPAISTMATAANAFATACVHLENPIQNYHW